MILERLEKIDEGFLKDIFVESEFIDPLQDILDRDSQQGSRRQSIPFVVLEEKKIVAFFTIETSNRLAPKCYNGIGDYWLESFFLTKEFVGKGYSKLVVTKLLNGLSAFFPTLSSLNLTVNFRNDIAQKVYRQCGFSESSNICHGGPAGPQYIFIYKISNTTKGLATV